MCNTWKMRKGIALASQVCYKPSMQDYFEKKLIEFLAVFNVDWLSSKLENHQFSQGATWFLSNFRMVCGQKKRVCTNVNKSPPSLLSVLAVTFTNITTTMIYGVNMPYPHWLLQWTLVTSILKANLNNSMKNHNAIVLHLILSGMRAGHQLALITPLSIWLINKAI